MGRPPRAPWESIAGLTTLYNAMIAPIGPYGLRAAARYQGETNADEPSGYEQLLGGLMANWRSQFGAGLPFLVVQLPNVGAVPTTPTEANWSEIREAQRRANDRCLARAVMKPQRQARTRGGPAPGTAPPSRAGRPGRAFRSAGSRDTPSGR